MRAGKKGESRPTGGKKFFNDTSWNYMWTTLELGLPLASRVRLRYSTYRRQWRGVERRKECYDQWNILAKLYLLLTWSRVCVCMSARLPFNPSLCLFKLPSEHTLDIARIVNDETDEFLSRCKILAIYEKLSKGWSFTSCKKSSCTFFLPETLAYRFLFSE